MKKIHYVALIIILLCVGIYFYFPKEGDITKKQDPVYLRNNKFYYSMERGNVDYESFLNESTKDYDLYKISFDSRNFLEFKTKIYGFLFIPKNKTEFPGVIFLPGGGGTKENRKHTGEILSKMGYAVLIIDQRGVGETGGVYLNFDSDYQVYSKGNESMQQLSVYDVLRSFDIMTNIKGIKKDKITIVGESMGARYGIIAAAMDKRIKGIIVISSSGLHINDDGSIYAPYFLSIDPDNYIADISPNYVIMLHALNDSVVPLKEAQYTFSLAKDPKDFKIFSNCSHGFCKDMTLDLRDSLKKILQE